MQQHAISAPEYFITRTEAFPRHRRSEARNPQSAGLFCSSNGAAQAQIPGHPADLPRPRISTVWLRHQSWCEQQNRRPPMFKNTVIALGAAVVLVTALGS